MVIEAKTVNWKAVASLRHVSMVVCVLIVMIRSDANARMVSKECIAMRKYHHVTLIHV